MFSLARLIPVLCAASGLMAQAMGDLNTLVIQASRFATHQTAGQAPSPDLILFRIIGTSGGGEVPAPMLRAADLQQWTLIYQIDPGGGPGTRPGDCPQSATIQCAHGLFTTMQYSPLPIFDAKSLQWAWFALSLEDAIAQLNGQGYTRGFTMVTLERPLHPGVSDECTFIFKCPLDQAFVGISAQTGATLWTEPFPY